MNNISYPVTITAIKDEAPGVKSFVLEKKDGSPIPYMSGQFLTFIFNLYGKEERRSYSLSSSPVANEPATITLKRIENGAYSRYLMDRLVPGSTLLTTGAAGLFTLPATITAYKQLFFFAAGIGITPVFSLIKAILHNRDSKMPVVLVYSNRTKEDTVFRNELDELAHQYKWFTVIYLYSTSYNLSRARLSKSLLPVLIEEHGLTTKDAMLFYVCGPFPYMRMVTYALEEQGIPAANIRKENFDTSLPIRRAVPSDTASHKVTLHFMGKSVSFFSQYPDTILQSALKNGINLPYSCQAGKCGSCASLCLEGKVWLSYNEVLTDKDIASGKILTCVGHPIGGDITLEA